jgi:hypothetical protein
MKLYILIYLLGSIISLIITLITLTTNKKKAEGLIDFANDRLSEKLNCYERVNFFNDNVYIAVNFLMSWVQVAMFLYSYLPSIFLIKIHFYRVVMSIFIWIHTKTGTIAHAVVDKHNQLIRDFNQKHGIKNE